MPINYANYPPHWREIRARILERAQHRCEGCGVPNYAYRISKSNEWTTDLMQVEAWTAADGERVGKIVLTISHANHDITDNRDENLKALCQRCHLAYDAKHHARTRRKKASQGQGELFT